MKHLVIAALLLLLSTGTALAAKYDLTFANTLLNSEFGTIVREAGMFGAYRGVAPAEPQGLTGFDIGVEASVVEIDGIWYKALNDNGDSPDYLVVPRLHVRKGLPFNLDIGASYTYVPESDLRLIGGEVQWALLEGSTVTPALALRGHYSTLQGVDDLDLSAYGADVVLSKGFAFLTPYIGGGVVQIDGEYTGNDSDHLQGGLYVLQDQSFTEYRGFGGVQIAMTVVRLTLEAEYSRLPIYTAKLSFGW
ncbi:MAG: hypothetical protein A2091_10315 [Desulfuromonadales bacterium GWD2_61_12]|nr:MAG: hypothetical protein A2091_10315 [Desulfuromonadales bacterium GWD2_61_12]OGR33913.1 MAG: hypothetical protein A2005_05615 [Desulfuromonadales bacterium GWC2_61_20]HAD03294.1 hypothetical protein [Desulfuromonas sp.]HBT82173.1 hypothetical protein [Desulfuromonas sp.]